MSRNTNLTGQADLKWIHYSYGRSRYMVSYEYAKKMLTLRRMFSTFLGV